MKRTRAKGDPDPGWQRINWDEALDLTAANLRKFAREDGPESVVFSAASPSTSATQDSADWIERLMRAYGSPNLCSAVELCGWGRFLAIIPPLCPVVDEDLAEAVAAVLRRRME